ncbi:FERM and PDZ domain-containing protein 4-like isoform X2 [Dendronephthya gigantea]|uniref:FERM and PDZ domain-containing protein 4-like isoform X2 n=1 Tax=Dendronephthya gigantea TaxID=151771 RepID=UPI00106BB438|nr:FERM and PDZ domain-containing protein 4-like isoform X2 [Dendronephthya gigantea]
MVLYKIPPRTRKVVISRHSDIGYGFVAGSEKPVLIRSVAEDGPSAGKLYANDQILKINEEDVGDMPQSAVIQRIKESSEELNLEVIASDDVQDVRNRGQRKSSIMSRTTREKRRSNPVSVRFADTPVLVQYVGSPPSYPFRRSSLPLIPNVLKIFLENGQTRSFLYNPTTVVKDLFASLADKIGLKKLDRFALVLQATQTLNDYIVQANERVSQVYTKRNCSSSAWLSKLLLIFAPKDVQKFWKEDPVAFDYFYRQMCSQVVEGRFGWELKYDIAIKLAALHLQQYAMEEKIGKGGKISVKAIEREVGSLENFVPTALINTMQKKDLQRILTQQIKQTRNLCPPGQKYISPLQAKLQYLKICSEMKTYGGKQFSAVVVDPTAEDQKFFQDQKVNSMIFVGPNVGLAHVTNPRSFTMQQIAEFSQINGLVITPHTEGKQNIKLFLNNSKSVTLIMGPIFETRDLVHLISGYHKHLVESNKPLSVIDMTCSDDVEEPVDEVPSYSDAHRVLRDDFSYRMDENDYEEEDVKEISFRQKPTFEGNEMYSLADQCENTQHAASLSNGSVKTHLSIRVSNNQRLSLKSIEEEALSPRSPKNDDTGLLLSHSPEKPSYVNGIRELKRNSYLQLSDDLASESNDEGPSEKTETIIHEKQEATQVENIQLTDSTESLVRNHTSIHISSPSHKMKNVDTNVNSENLCNGDLTNNVHEVQDEIPLTPNLQSSSSNTSDDISSLSSSLGDDSPRTSPLTISNAISSNPKTSKEIISPSESKDNTLNTNVQAMVKHAMTDNYNEELPRNETENDKTENDSPTGNDKTRENDSPTGNAQTNEFDETDGNRLDILSRSISKDPILQNGCLPSGMKANGDIKSFREKRRRSSGYISSYRDICQIYIIFLNVLFTMTSL